MPYNFEELIINVPMFTLRMVLDFQHKRSNEESGSRGVIRGPYNANKQSRYVELVLVVDTMEYKEFGSIPEVSLHCKKIANIINAVSCCP
jgi:hypothetical protein